MLAMGLLASVSLNPKPTLAQTGDIRVTITEDFISYLLETQLAGALEGQQMQIENPQIDLKPDSQINLTIGTTVPILGNIEPTISIGVAVANNQIDLTIGNIALNGATVPAAMLAGQIGPIEQMAEEQANQALADLSESAGLTLSDIRTTETLITIYLQSTGE
jgi:hypothetical protein